jgi:hypothetical protein
MKEVGIETPLEFIGPAELTLAAIGAVAIPLVVISSLSPVAYGARLLA